jgi:hypothetical protein
MDAKQSSEPNYLHPLFVLMQYALIGCKGDLLKEAEVKQAREELIAIFEASNQDSESA